MNQEFNYMLYPGLTLNISTQESILELANQLCAKLGTSIEELQKPSKEKKNVLLRAVFILKIRSIVKTKYRGRRYVTEPLYTWTQIADCLHLTDKPVREAFKNAKNMLDPTFGDADFKQLWNKIKVDEEVNV